MLAAFDDPDIESIVIKKSTQVGGTVCLWAHMLWKATHRPAPCMVVLPDRESAIEFRDRVYGNALENQETSGMVPPKREWNSRYIDLTTMRVYLAWSGSAQKLRMRACQTVYLSEVDVFGSPRGGKGGDPNKAAQERTKSFYSRQLYRESSPTAEPSTIAGEYEESSQGQWYCPCPHCGTYQSLRFFPYRLGELQGKGGVSGFLDEFGQLKPVDDAARDCHYVCKTGCRIESQEIDPMVQKGVYAAKGQQVDKDGRVTGPPPDSRKWGLHLWSIHSPTISLADIVRDYIKQKRSNNLSDFMTNWLGLEFSSRRKMPTWEEFGKRNASIFERGTVWHDSYFLTTGVDVQGERVKYLTVAWGDRCTSWILDWGELWRDEDLETGDIASDLAQLVDRVVKYAYPVFDGGVNQIGREKVYSKLIGIDSNHRTMDVHNFVRHCRDPRVRAVRGDHQVSPGDKYRHRKVERNTRTGEAYAGGLSQWGIYVDVFKHDLVERICLRKGNPGCIYLPRGMVEHGKAVLQEILNEPPQLEEQRNGRKKIVFKPKSGSIPVDWWDTFVYARATAEMVVDGLPGRPGWDASRWPAAG